jgi:tetratricopeptide (TPR) repeat protein
MSDQPDTSSRDSAVDSQQREATLTVHGAVSQKQVIHPTEEGTTRVTNHGTVHGPVVGDNYGTIIYTGARASDQADTHQSGQAQRKFNTRLKAASVLLFLLSLTSIALVLQQKSKPRFMTGDIRIAFRTLDAQLPAADVSLDIRTRYTNMLVANLEKSLQTQPNPRSLSYEIWGPTNIADAGIAVLAQNRVATLANELDANIIVYGSVGEQNMKGDLALSMFVADTAFEDGADLLGSYYLGGSIEFDPPLTETLSRVQTSNQIQTRLEVITNVILGLSHLLSSKRDAASLRDAQQYFGRALEQIRSSHGSRIQAPPQVCPSGFVPLIPVTDTVDPQAESTLLVLQGNTTLQSGQYDRAEDLYSEAAALNCRSARPYLGMAATLVRKTSLLTMTESLPNEQNIRILSDTLTLADQYLRWAEQAPERPENALFIERYHYIRGQWYLASLNIPTINHDQTYPHIVEEFLYITKSYMQRPDPHESTILQLMAASAYANQGFAQISLDPPLAIKNYEQALGLTDNPGQKAQWLLGLSYAYENNRDCIQAKKQLEVAKGLATTPTQRERISERQLLLSTTCF